MPTGRRGLGGAAVQSDGPDLPAFSLGVFVKSRVRALFWFLFSLVILGLASTPAYGVVDRLLLVGMATLLLTLSVLEIREVWKSRGNPTERENKGMLGQLYLFPRSWQRWIMDEHDDKKGGKP